MGTWPSSSQFAQRIRAAGRIAATGSTAWGISRTDGPWRAGNIEAVVVIGASSPVRQADKTRVRGRVRLRKSRIASGITAELQPFGEWKWKVSDFSAGFGVGTASLEARQT